MKDNLILKRCQIFECENHLNLIIFKIKIFSLFIFLLIYYSIDTIIYIKYK